MRVLFLDIDGVLNSREVHDSVPRRGWDIYPEHVVHLNALLDRVPDLFIVVSSSWRLEYTRGELERELVAAGARVAGRVLGVTPRSGHETRGAEIEDWLAQREGVVGWVIVDDHPDDLAPAQLARTVVTTPERGLLAAHIDEAVLKLG
jgi:hypothetical protein